MGGGWWVVPAVAVSGLWVVVPTLLNESLGGGSGQRRWWLVGW